MNTSGIKNSNFGAGLATLSALTRRVATVVFALVLGTVTSFAAAPSWTNPSGLLNTMTVHGVVQHSGGGAYVTASGSMLSAWKGAEIRGVTTVFDGPATQMQFQLSVGSNLGAETGLTLKCYDAATDTVFDVSPGFDFAADTTLNSVFNPGLYLEDAGPLRFTAAAPGTAGGTGTATVTVGTQVTVLENGTQVFSATVAGGTAPYSYSWTLAGSTVATTATYSYQPSYTAVLHPNTAIPGQIVRLTVTDAALATATATWSTVVTQDVDRLPTTPGAPLFSPASPTTADVVSATSTSTDADGDAITYTKVWTHGATTVTAATLAASYTKKGETWNLAVTASTNPYGTGTVSSGTVNGAVTIANTVPVANTPDLVGVIMNSVGQSLSMTGTDADVADLIDTLSFAIVADPVHGAMKTSMNGTLTSLNPATGTVTYIPATGFTGTDTFQFTAFDGTATSAPATFSIQVFQPFEMAINVEDIDNPTNPIPGIGIVDVTVGTAGGATDNADPGIDTLAPPPPSGKAYVELIAPGDEALLNADFRPNLDGARYYIKITPDADEVTPGASVNLTWDIADLPAGKNWHMWQLTADPFSGGQTVPGGIDMATEAFVDLMPLGVVPDALQAPVYFLVGTPSVPTVATVSPASGPTAGGTVVTITGTEFMTGAAVQFGAGNATDVVVVNATTITCKTPAVGYTGTAVDVIVTNADSGTGTKDEAFLFNNAPTANAGGPYNLGMYIGATLDAGASLDVDGGALTFAWDLNNDGTFETTTATTVAADVAPQLICTYAELGNVGTGAHTIAVCVTDIHGLSATATGTINRANLPPTANAGGPYVIDEGATLSLDAHLSVDPDGLPLATYDWELDNVAPNGYNDLHTTSATPPALNWATLVALGLNDIADPLTGLPTNDIKVRVTDVDGGTADSVATTLTVYRNLPNASFTVDAALPPASGINRFEDVDFAQTATHGKPGVLNVAYEWDFQYNGSTFRTMATGANVTWRFAEYRVYNVALRVTDQNGRTDMATGLVTVSGGTLAPVAAISGTPLATTIMTALDVSGSNTALTPATPLSYKWQLWNFALGTPAWGTLYTGTNPNYTISAATLAAYGYTTAGVYNNAIKFTVTDSVNGSSDSTVALELTNDVGADPEAWTLPINVAFGSESTLVFGVAPTGVQGVDAFDAYNDGVMWDGAFTGFLTPDGGPTLQTAINSNNVDGNGSYDYADWILEVKSGSVNPTYLWWDPASIPAAGMWLFELDGSAGVPAADGRLPAGCVPQDMRVDGDLLVPVGQTKYYRLVYGKLTQSITFEAGWNLFSLQNGPFDPTMAAILGHGAFVAGTNWGWNPVTQEYAAAATFEGLPGYWVYFDADTTIPVDGIRINDRSYNLVEGWNLVGVTASRVLTANPNLFLPGYSYDAAAGLYEEVNVDDTLVPGKAYWIYANAPTVLNP